MGSDDTRCGKSCRRIHRDGLQRSEQDEARSAAGLRAWFSPTVKRLGYLPNIHARRLASRDTRTLGIIVSDIENPFFPEVIKSFLARTRQLGYEAILSDTDYNPRRTQEAASRMMAHSVSGVAIMTSEISARLINELTHRKIAVTFLDLAPARGYVSTLRIDYASGIEQIVKYLLSNRGTVKSRSWPAGRN